tara:strand:- start:26 stop:214 length:189 start_codon:yes stop_codon:yes gene_type:complete
MYGSLHSFDNHRDVLTGRGMLILRMVFFTVIFVMVIFFTVAASAMVMEITLATSRSRDTSNY